VHPKCLQKQRLEGGPFSAFVEQFWNCQECGASYRMKYQRHLLRILTWPCIFFPLFVLSQVLLLYGSSMLFNFFLPWVIPVVRKWHPESSEKVAFNVIMPYLGWDIGFGLGGLLVLVFVRKVGTSTTLNDASSLLSYLGFLPMFIHTMREPEAGQGEDSWIHNDWWASTLKWYMVIPYTLFTLFFFLRAFFRGVAEFLDVHLGWRAGG